MLGHPGVIRAADSSKLPELSDNSADAACRSIKTALHKLADAEHDEALALDLASGAGNSMAIVESRLSVVLDRMQDLRAALKHARDGAVARDPTVDQCTRMGFRALVDSEKLTSDVETVLFGGEDSSRAEPPAIRPGGAQHAPQPSLPAQP